MFRGYLLDCSGRLNGTILATVIVLGLLGSSTRVAAQGYSSEVAASKMTPAPGFAVDLVAAEPHVRQPVCIEFDDRGRLWVVQYLQYPNPAGLKRVKVDRYSRTVYDRVPEPPPRGPKGADRITILDDVNGDGRVDQSRDFVRGLNLTTGIAFGYGGVFVLNVPYLLFYPDRNHDDIPDGDPEVLLSGFGMEDTSSLANSLTWGPDGWLYGTQGTNITAHIRGIDFEQGVWRYQPLTHEFELFCEGGGNSWGLDFDENGQLYFSTNFGGYLMVHGLQGAYYVKQFQKHGELHNPYAFGFFDHVPHQNFQGGHVTVGGLVYQEDLFPASFRGKYIGADLLGHTVNWHTITHEGSTVRTEHGGTLLKANDAWFAPSDVTTGPDGAIYVADWFDKRTAHPDPDADWDKSNGRIYRIRPANRPISSLRAATNLSGAGGEVSSDKLIEILLHGDGWHSRRALRMLAERRDARIANVLRQRLTRNDVVTVAGKPGVAPRAVFNIPESDPIVALRCLWGAYASGGFDEWLALQMLDHPAEAVRAWTVRLLGDQHNVSEQVEDRLRRLAERENSPVVLAQLACSAKRLPPACGLRIAREVAVNPLSERDPCIPLFVWWAVENHATAAREVAVGTFASRDAWRVPLIRKEIVGRLLKRYTAEGTSAGFRLAANVFAAAPTAADRASLLSNLNEALSMISARPAKNAALGAYHDRFAVVTPERQHAARRFPKCPPELRPVLDAIWTAGSTDPLVLRVACRLGSPEAYRRMVELIADRQVSTVRRREILQIVGELGDADCVEPVLAIVRDPRDQALRSAALKTLGHFDDSKIADAVLAEYPRMPVGLQAEGRALLFGRREWARALLARVEQGLIGAADVPTDEVRRVALYQDADLDATVRKLWGNIRAGTTEEKLADIRRLSNDLRAATGNPNAGHELFKKHCATCHVLFGEGTKLGPDLTTANRKDREFLLVSVVDPSVQVRKEFLVYAIETHDGRVITGCVVDQDPSTITLVGPKNDRTKVRRNEIAEMKAMPNSLMPERLLEPLKPQEVRDLFAYLQR
ncbi:MAG TPA: PVC-type heme-binding CxxCH protein [Planctomycetaceae bacterium]|jgi:putative membrane-bound dehydrogenase-like protein|nr:PVC-type heme-binding CxxCH protein [Planctomycetaceae bacterium]